MNVLNVLSLTAALLIGVAVLLWVFSTLVNTRAEFNEREAYYQRRFEYMRSNLARRREVLRRVRRLLNDKRKGNESK